MTSSIQNVGRQKNKTADAGAGCAGMCFGEDYFDETWSVGASITLVSSDAGTGLERTPSG